MNKAFTYLLLIALAVWPLAGCKKSSDASTDAGKPSARQTQRPNDPVELKLKWPVGNRYVQRLEVEQKMNMIMAQMPKPMEQGTAFGQEYALTVLSDRPGGGRELELEYLAANMDVMMNGQQVINFDSRGESVDESNPMVGMFRKMVGSKLKFLLDASNKVEKVEGVKELTDKITQNASPQVRPMMASLINEDQFKQILDANQILPTKPVKPGDSWPVQMDVGAGPMGTLALDLTYTFKAWDSLEFNGGRKSEKRECALLEFAGTVKSKGPGAGMMGMKMSIENGTASGKVWFDPELGTVLQSVTDQTMKLHMNFDRPPGAAASPGGQPQNITGDLNQKISVKLADFTKGSK